MAEITFSIPYYEGKNPEKTRLLLKKTIQSVINQTFTNWLLIVNNNGASDNSITKLVNEFNDSRISLINNGENIGAARNFNACIDRAVTDLVTILHSDDELMPEYAENIITAAKKNNDYVIYYCRARIINENDKLIFSMPDYVKGFIQPKAAGTYTILEGEGALTRLMVGNFIFFPTICYRKSVLNKERFVYDWEIVGDFEFITRLLLKGYSFVGINKIGYSYRRHENHTAISRKNLKMFQEEILFFNYIAALCKQKGWYHAEEVARRKTIIKLNLLYCTVKDLSKGRLKDFFSKIKFAFSTNW